MIVDTAESPYVSDRRGEYLLFAIKMKKTVTMVLRQREIHERKSFVVA